MRNKILLFLIIGISIFSCKKPNNSNPILTDADLNIAATTMGKWEDSLVNAYSGDPKSIYSTWLKLAPKIRVDSGVTNVTVTPTGIIISLMKGVEIFYDNSPDINIDAKTSASFNIQKRQANSGGNILLFNQQQGDAYHPDAEISTKILNDNFSQAGFTVNQPDYNLVNLDYLRKGGLKGYKAIIFSTHGFYKADGSLYKCLLLTGEATISQTDGLAYIIRQFSQEIREDISEGRVEVCGVHDTRGAKNFSYYYGITEKFMDYYYHKGDLSGTIFYNAACQSMTGPEFPDELTTKLGCSVYIGWNETNYTGQVASAYLFGYMLTGDSLLGAYNSLDPSFRHNDYFEKDENGNQRHVVADLKYYPLNNFTNNIKLVGNGSLSFQLVKTDFEAIAIDDCDNNGTTGSSWVLIVTYKDNNPPATGYNSLILHYSGVNYAENFDVDITTEIQAQGITQGEHTVIIQRPDFCAYWGPLGSIKNKVSATVDGTINSNTTANEVFRPVGANKVAISGQPHLYRH